MTQSNSLVFAYLLFPTKAVVVDMMQSQVLKSVHKVQVFEVENHENSNHR